MTRPEEDGAATPSPREAIAHAIQSTAAARLGRGFIPLALLGLLAIVQLVTAGGTGGAAFLLAGALGTGGAMLAYGVRIVQKAFGREHRPWMTGAMAASVIPPSYALYVVAWRGLRGLGGGDGIVGAMMSILFIGLGVWVLRCWMRVVEVERLARTMASNLDEYGGPA